MKKYDLFISYSRKDFDEVDQFVYWLQQQIPTLTYWFDITGIESGDEFEEKIITAINNASFVLFALSENSINSQWAKDEVIYAKNIGKKIIPILLKGASLNEGWFLFKFGRIDCIDTTNHSQVKKLVTNLSEWTNKPYSNEYSTQCNHKIPHDYNCTMIIDYSNNHYIKEIYNMGNLIKSELTPKYNTPIIEKINSNSEQNSSNDPRKPKYSPIIATIIFLAECIFAIIMLGISHKIHFDSDGIILACIFPIPCIFIFIFIILQSSKISKHKWNILKYSITLICVINSLLLPMWNGSLTGSYFILSLGLSAISTTMFFYKK